MPILGFGVFQIPDHRECERAVADAIKLAIVLLIQPRFISMRKLLEMPLQRAELTEKNFFLSQKFGCLMQAMKKQRPLLKSL